MKENTFRHRIDKETINRLPVAAFDGEVVVVRTEQALAAAIDYLNRQKYVGVDTETRPSFVHGFYYPTSLIQIATEQRCYLFQIKHLGFPKPLRDFFGNPAVAKIWLAFNDDLVGLRRLHYFEPRNCIDIQKIVNRWGILDMGLQKVFAIVFGQKITKNQQLTNWENPVLTDEQARYASTDAWATLRIYLELINTEQLPEKQCKKIIEEDHILQVKRQQEQQALALQKRAEEAKKAEEAKNNNKPEKA